MPGAREKPLYLQSTTDLWMGVIGMPGFGGLLLAAPLMGTPLNGDQWGKVWAVLFFGGFFTLAGVLMGIPRLKELGRRGAWVPPGTASQPVLVTLILALLIIGVGVAVQFVGVRLVRLSGLAS